MLCARATLTAGDKQRRYPAGTRVRAVVFAKVESPEQLQASTFRSVAERGWSQMTIDGSAILADDHVFPNYHSEEAVAFRGALDTGLSIVVLGLVQ